MSNDQRETFIETTFNPHLFGFHLFHFAMRNNLSWIELLAYFQANERQMMLLADYKFTRDQKELQWIAAHLKLYRLEQHVALRDFFYPGQRSKTRT